jgi:hypothetical protein
MPLWTMQEQILSLVKVPRSFKHTYKNRADPSSGFSVDRSIDSILSEIYQKWNITKLLNILIQSNLFKRSNFQGISQFIHDICQKKFKSQQSLKRHLKIHDGTKLFCPSCTQYFDSEEKLNKHKIDKHSYNLLCSFCGKTFNKRMLFDIGSILV